MEGSGDKQNYWGDFCEMAVTVMESEHTEPSTALNQGTTATIKTS